MAWRGQLSGKRNVNISLELSCRIFATHPVFGLRSRICGSHWTECSSAIFIFLGYCYGHYVRATTWNSFGMAHGCVFSSRVQLRSYQPALVFFLYSSVQKIMLKRCFWVQDMDMCWRSGAAVGNIMGELCQ